MSFKIFYAYYLCIKVIIMKITKQNGNAYATVLYDFLIVIVMLPLIRCKNSCMHVSSNRTTDDL